RSAHNPGRWVILGEPGAGKSTLARHLAWQLCAPDAPPDAPIPVLLSLARLVDKGEHPFTLAERELVRLTGAGAGLADRLHALAATPDRIWLLLDGFDEVPDRAVGDAITGLKGWHHSLPHATLAVFSRPVGWAERSLGALFHRADVRPLSPEQQQALLRAWLGDDSGAAVWQRIADRPSLVELAANPFMLTLLAMLSRRAAALPLTRSGLYDAAITLLLERGHCEQPSKGVASPTVARALLAAISLALTEGGESNWSLAALIDAAHAARDADPALDRKCTRSWPGAIDEALKDIAQHSGIIAAHDGAAEKWRYLHRSLRERLAADALAAQGADAVVARIQTLGIRQGRGGDVDEARLGQWGETLGMACGLLPDPLTALQGLRAASPPLALRMLADVEALTAEDALRLHRRHRSSRWWNMGW
ncbi:MAG: NACHT domain-containing protein, partial [bacterium]